MISLQKKKLKNVGLCDAKSTKAWNILDSLSGNSRELLIPNASQIIP